MPERHRPVVRARWRSRVPGAGGIVLAVAWLAYFAALQWSVVRYRIPIVAVLTLAAVGLALWQWRGWRVVPSRGAVVLMLAGSALATAAVPLFSYLAPTGLAVATTALVAAPLACAVALWSGRRRGATIALGAAVAGYAVAAATAVVSSPRPRIDVWVTLQQASDGLARLENFYAMTWTGSPGIQDAFTYLPWTVVLLAPGRWLAGDVRWALAVWTLLAALAAVLLTRGAAADRGSATADAAAGQVAGASAAAGQVAGPSAAAGQVAGASVAAAEDDAPRRWWTAAVVVSLLLLAPGTLTQLDQAWTEPLLLAGIAWWAVLVRRGHAWWAVVPLAMACASKQHLALLLPVLLLWRPFGWQRTVATGALTGVLIAPWFLASPADFVHDTVSLLVTFHPIKFANTLYLLALNTFGVTLPFVVTGLVVLGTLAAVCLTVWRRQPDLASLLRWLALVLLVANLVNKQAFYNQFWLVGALVVLSLAVPVSRPSSSTSPSGYTVSPRR